MAKTQKYLVPLLGLIALLTMGIDCHHRSKLPPKNDDLSSKTQPPLQPSPNLSGEWEPIVSIQTTEGEIRVKLYNETPLHRDNFLKLVGDRFYDSLLFHRVIQSFVIQGGDPDSKHANPLALLGDGDVGYWVPAEFMPEKHFHKRGALAAARESDLINPNQESSGCQFYIVQGRTFTDSLLKLQGKRIEKNLLYNRVIKRPENKWIIDKYAKFNKEKSDSALFYSSMIDKIVEKEIPGLPEHQFTPEQVKTYTTVGGTPHLDGSYTVFGEVIQGMEIVDKIAAAPRDKNDRPLTDIRIIRMRELKKI